MSHHEEKTGVASLCHVSWRVAARSHMAVNYRATLLTTCSYLHTSRISSSNCLFFSASDVHLSFSRSLRAGKLDLGKHSGAESDTQEEALT